MTTPPSKRLRKESSEYVTVHQEDVHIQGLGKPHIITLPSPAAKIAIQQSLLIFLKLQDPVCCQKILHRSLAEVSHSLKIILFLEIIIFTNTPGWWDYNSRSACLETLWNKWKVAQMPPKAGLQVLRQGADNYHFIFSRSIPHRTTIRMHFSRIHKHPHWIREESDFCNGLYFQKKVRHFSINGRDECFAWDNERRTTHRRVFFFQVRCALVMGSPFRCIIYCNNFPLFKIFPLF